MRRLATVILAGLTLSACGLDVKLPEIGEVDLSAIPGIDGGPSPLWDRCINEAGYPVDKWYPEPDFRCPHGMCYRLVLNDNANLVERQCYGTMQGQDIQHGWTFHYAGEQYGETYYNATCYNYGHAIFATDRLEDFHCP